MPRILRSHTKDIFDSTFDDEFGIDIGDPFVSIDNGEHKKLQETL